MARLSIAPRGLHLADRAPFAPRPAGARGAWCRLYPEMPADPAEPLVRSRRDALAQLASAEAALRRTARRYSLCADDAYQRAVEILLTKSPPPDLRHLVV